MMWAPSSAARWAAYPVTSMAVSPSFDIALPRGYDQTITARPRALASRTMSRSLLYISKRKADPG